MKALTVKQPWAWAIAAGHKTIENRSRPTKHRGPLAIHAGAAWAPLGGMDRRVLQAFGPLMSRQEFAVGGIDPALHNDRLVVRAVIAVVDLVDCHAAGDGCCGNPWGDQSMFDPLHHWVLANASALDEPVPAVGRLGLWDIDLPPRPAVSSGKSGLDGTGSA